VAEEKDDLPINSLLRHPEIAQEVGFLMMYAANLEIWMFAACSIVLRKNQDLAQNILQNVDNLSAKIAIVYDLAKLREGILNASEILSTKEKTLAALAFRNMLAHGNFGLSPQGRMLINFGITNPKRSKPKSVTLTPEKIRVHVDALRHTIGTIKKHFGADVFVFHQGTIDGKPSTSPQKPSLAIPKTKMLHKGRQSQRNRTPPEPSQE